MCRQQIVVQEPSRREPPIGVPVFLFGQLLGVGAEKIMKGEAVGPGNIQQVCACQFVEQPLEARLAAFRR